MELEKLNLYRDTSWNDIKLRFCGHSECLPLHYYGPGTRPYYLMHFVLSGKGRLVVNKTEYLIEEKQKRRPVVFLTNGFETKIIDNQYPERKVSAFYSKRDLEKLFNLQTMKSSLKYITVDKNIAGRYYQEAAIKAVCDSFDIKNRRKALLVWLQVQERPEQLLHCARYY